jgi:hypothetical protein
MAKVAGCGGRGAEAPAAALSAVEHLSCRLSLVLSGSLVAASQLRWLDQRAELAGLLAGRGWSSIPRG